MKRQTRSRSGCAIKAARWTSYALAGAATAVAASNDAEGAIIYSGVLNKTAGNANPVFLKTLVSNSHQGTKNLGEFGFEQFPGGFGYAFFSMATANGKFAGINANGSNYPSNLGFGAHVSAGLHFIGPARGDMASTFSTAHPNAKFSSAGTGYLGFEFNVGGGLQYGWARVTMGGKTGNSQKVVDYAYGTPGQAITVGEESAAPTPEPASLGLLAIGAVGLLAVRLRGKRKISSAVD